VRFKKLDDLALDVIGEAIRQVPARKYIEYVDSARAAAGEATSARTASTISSSRRRPSGSMGL
jgi:hypothetical protein